MSSLGQLRNGNQAAPIEQAWSAPRCRAKAKSTGESCRNPAMRGRPVCRLHGGKGGPKTAEGRRRIAEARTKHGRYSKTALQARRDSLEFLRSIGARTRI